MKKVSGVAGLHHVTSVVADINRARHFYVEVLGMVELAKTVSFDETTVLQLYCGQKGQTPGTIVSLLHRPKDGHCSRGTGQVSNVVFTIENNTERQWLQRLRDNEVAVDGLGWSFGQRLICLSDPEGLAIALRETSDQISPIEPRLAVTTISSIEVTLNGFEHTSRLFSDVLDFEIESSEGPVTRFRNKGSRDAFAVDLISSPTQRKGSVGHGMIQDIILKVPRSSDLAEMRSRLVAAGFDVTPILDRLFFKAIYFKGPEDITYAVASEDPGFVGDNRADALLLPSWLESQRNSIERKLLRISRGR